MNLLLPRRRVRAQLRKVPLTEDPISAELYSVERLEHYAHALAREQSVGAKPSAGVSLQRRLRENAVVLAAAYHTLADDSRVGKAFSPAAEWLVDNYYVIDEHVRTIRRDLPAGYYRQLPKLSVGPLRGAPRVYGIAWALVAHTDSRFELDTLFRFARAYQQVQPLTIGELWAIAITMRVVLIENLRRLAACIVHRRTLRDEADKMADALLDVDPATIESNAARLADLGDTELPPTFAAQLFQRLRDHDPASTPALPWLHRKLAATGTSADDVVHVEHQRQGAINVSVRNVITSLKLISSVDWPKFVEGVSLVDQMMRAESHFGTLDFATRDLYRHAIEDVARGSGHTELEVARRTLDLAKRPGLDARARVPGFYLVADGRGALEVEFGYRIPWNRRLARWTARAGLPGYLGAIAFVSAALITWFWWRAGFRGGNPLAVCGEVACAVLLASEIGVSAANLWVSRLCGAFVLPALEFADGVPAEFRTLVAVPTLLTSTAEIEEHVQNLEVHYLASQDGDMRFALLSDWTDSATESAPEDAVLLDAAAAAIARLNAAHGAIDGEDRFLLLHRRRQWNERQRCWMGWERKRGKLLELGRLLLGASGTSFVAIHGEPPRVPRGVRYVISLDADTRLPRNAAKQLIGKMAHPLNQPVLDAASRRVVAGYAILQPRVTSALPIGHEGTPFQAVFAGPSGIDPYAFAVSDVYQDLFGEGTFTGKGIYDVAAFDAALDGRVGENQILSHDLFEGIFARCGLASDVEVVEEYPARYDLYSRRQHRWTRGDWQLVPWIFGRGGATPALGRWKLLDNLRRSLVAPVACAALVLACVGTAPLAVSLFVVACLVVPALLPFAFNLLPPTDGDNARTHYRGLRDDFFETCAAAGLRLALLADQAWVSADAILRTLVRVGITHRRLLEWTTAAQAKLARELNVAGYYRRMSGSVLATLAATGVLVAAERRVPWTLLPFAIVWILAPLVAERVSRPGAAPNAKPLTGPERDFLRGIARQTWTFFATFVTDQEHMLPPDNFQELPSPVVATRTSPTNIGLYLLSVVAAREFGWLGCLDALERLEATFATLDSLERFRGHFYNWYDTRDLRGLDPKYVSTVDSGNLAGHLLTLAESCRQWAAGPVLGAAWRDGVRDTVIEFERALRALDEDRRDYGVSPGQLAAAVAALHAVLDETDAPTTAERLARLATETENIRDFAEALIEERRAGADAPLLHQARMLRANVLGHVRDCAADAESAAGRALHEARMLRLAQRARSLALAMEFAFLVEPERQLLSIGYRVAERALDPSCYDLLASEARLASYFAIAKGDLPVRHWFRLGRLLTPVDRGSALVSWSGSMFEYLMPELVMRDPTGSVLGETARLIVRRQIEYGLERKLPWGVSESAFNARDVELTYQYSSFGVPGLGLQRGLGEEAVIAPYATGLAAMVDPRAALENFAVLEADGGRGRFGWYEALDFTPARVPENQRVAVVCAYMAHHQGMILIALANVLCDELFRKRFSAEPMIQANELLLQERAPRGGDATPPRADEVAGPAAIRELAPVMPRRFDSPHHVAPRTHLLSNGNYTVMITVAGSGFSRWQDLAVTRWREDSTCDQWGSYIFLRDVASGQVWSAGYQPMGTEPDAYEVAFFEDSAQFTRRDGRIETSTEILVSPEDDAEVRRVTITNSSNRAREIELTSYVEVALNLPAADSAHPAFSKMFIQTEYLADGGALLATRRANEPGKTQPWVAHVTALDGVAAGGVQFETDRARFLGRGRDLRDAVSIMDARPLSNTAGTVLDPVLALRRRVVIAPGKSASVSFWTIVAGSRAHAIALADKHSDVAAFERVKTLSWTQAQVQLRYLSVDFDEAQEFQRIANRVLYADASLRAPRDLLGRNRTGQNVLWTYGISGDLPIVLIRIDDEHDIELVKQLLRAHQYWQSKRLAVDLVILNDRPPSYASELQQGIEAAIRTARTRVHDEEGPERGRIFLVRGDLMPAANRDSLQAAARVVLIARRGSLADQLARLRDEPAPRAESPRAAAGGAGAPVRNLPSLEFFNGLGGFADEGREYVTVLEEHQWTPAPWTNVIANRDFGFQVSTDGTGSTWSLNSRENQLTPWSNDPVSNAPSEVLYLRDAASGDVWSATPLPIRESSPYVVRHGFGYTRFEHASHDIALDLLQFVPLDAPIKISRLRITNESGEIRRLSVTHYVDWVLGSQRVKSAPYIVTEFDPETGALLARNPWNAEFHERVAFMDMRGRQRTGTGDRAEFLGRHGSLAEPAALLGDAPLSNRVGGGFDPCGALQAPCRIGAGETIEFVCMLGEESTAEAAIELIRRYRTADLDAEFARTKAFWTDTLTAVQVKTPDRSMDVMLNGWLLYQTLVCRVWARAGFYQASGAYGFRDQLQDVMALCIARPEFAREHILRAAARQFPAGDVQHWWLPTSGQGVQTRIADDRIWLAYVVEHYLEVTGDRTILDTLIPFLDGAPLAPDKHEAFAAPAATARTESLFEHCALALDSSLSIGSHGLPLFGAGDWNDGMNRVGAGGQGESVWLAWFLYTALLGFAPIAAARGDEARAALWRKHAFAVRQSIEREAWDGDWYRRGYYDDGTPLGSVTSDECRIDAIAQSWALISGAGEPERARRAMSAVNAQLVRRSDGLVALFTPPFDHSRQDPGYIKAYPPGLRENGGQYTHAAMWTTLAFALQGDGDLAGELFSLMNPINHASTRAGIHRYKVEPYVACADVYTAAAHVGRGGWTWYTGSAGWMYRTAIEGMLGIHVAGASLRLDPCIPRGWPRFEFTLRHRRARYDVVVENPAGVNRGVQRTFLDGAELTGESATRGGENPPRGGTEITLADDALTHRVRIVLG